MPRRPSPPAPEPLKPLVFQVLLALVDGQRPSTGSGRPELAEGRHGWSLVREVQQRGEFGRIMPGNFALVVSRWHCIHTSICRSGRRRFGLTIAAWISVLDTRPLEANSTWRDAGP